MNIESIFSFASDAPLYPHLMITPLMPSALTFVQSMLLWKFDTSMTVSGFFSFGSFRNFCSAFIDFGPKYPSIVSVLARCPRSLSFFCRDFDVCCPQMPSAVMPSHFCSALTHADPPEPYVTELSAVYYFAWLFFCPEMMPSCDTPRNFSSALTVAGPPSPSTDSFEDVSFLAGSLA